MSPRYTLVTDKCRPAAGGQGEGHTRFTCTLICSYHPQRASVSFFFLPVLPGSLGVSTADTYTVHTSTGNITTALIRSATIR